MALVSPWNHNSVFCGGTIINKRFVMTAAHCTEGSADNINVKVGYYRPYWLQFKIIEIMPL